MAGTPLQFPLRTFLFYRPARPGDGPWSGMSLESGELHNPKPIPVFRPEPGKGGRMWAPLGISIAGAFFANVKFRLELTARQRVSV